MKFINSSSNCPGTPWKLFKNSCVFGNCVNEWLDGCVGVRRGDPRGAGAERRVTSRNGGPFAGQPPTSVADQLLPAVLLGLVLRLVRLDAGGFCHVVRSRRIIAPVVAAPVPTRHQATPLLFMGNHQLISFWNEPRLLELGFYLLGFFLSSFFIKNFFFLKSNWNWWNWGWLYNFNELQLMMVFKSVKDGMESNSSSSTSSSSNSTFPPSSTGSGNQRQPKRSLWKRICCTGWLDGITSRFHTQFSSICI